MWRAPTGTFCAASISVVKDSDAHVRFTFITGVSKFSRVSLFSGLNNLRDITLDPRYSAICGYTDADLDTVFAPELPGLDREEVRHWYNGYGWLGPERVYNPFDILLLFDSRQFAAHWFETGTPTFLIETLVERGVGSFALGAALLRRMLSHSFIRGYTYGRPVVGVLWPGTASGSVSTRCFRAAARSDHDGGSLRVSCLRLGSPGHSRGVLVRWSWGKADTLRWPQRRRCSRDGLSAHGR